MLYTNIPRIITTPCKQENKKTMKTSAFYPKALFVQGLIFAAIMLLTTSCYDPDYFPCVRAAGNQVEEARNTAAFHSIDLMLHGKVIITHGENYDLVVSAPENILPLINTRVSGGNLMIGNDKCIRNHINEVVIYVTMPEIRSLRVSGSGNISTTDSWDAETIHIDISGSGDVSGAFSANQINTRISGSGNVNLKGQAQTHNVIISGSGQVYGFDMVSNTADIRISGSGHANVNITNFLNARISGSGNIFYKGNPSVQLQVSGSGKLVKR